MKKLLAILLLGLLLLLTACGGEESDENTDQQASDESQGDKGTISIGMNNWAENVAVSNMWKIILEDKGYNVELTSVEKAFLYEALSAGDLDIGMEIWLPNTDKAYYDKYKDEIDWRENWYEGTDLALVVPSYMKNINSIEDLNDHKEELDSQIVGIDAGASIMSLTEEVINAYDLDFELASSSEPTMLTELQNNIEKEEPIVVTLWKPHWSFAEMDLKILEDPKNVYGDSENISYAARKGLEEDQPEVVKWFDNFKLDDEQLGSLMATINEAESEEEGAQAWIDEHQDLISEWTK
ncbi:glycine betaine ABC transporter substrate-binding protein [Sediminibacillus halophilus]|uniref:Glycine betaine/proline transport system substrate-binding protein n=1 Tax=Sediminibacillus halophilus TaxID=482461 RepID=A0A1G9LPQ1_9BACI|nr:glycine betaine ABC transporter substrate-binding protein [Sediminibacillus halophilus]SDL64029.1 glycine betaine/proline transport system substrate-binding protein [Sediminibacillus halophilus]